MSSTGEVDMNENTPQKKKPPYQQLNRACEACRLSKVRCLMDSPSASQCQRCSKANRTCIFTAPQKRRQRKRTDVRVAELEREVRAMRALLRKTRISPDAQENEEFDEDEIQDPNSAVEDESRESPQFPSMPYYSDDTWKSIKPSPLSNYSHKSHLDIIDREIISIELADELLATYKSELSGYYPAIHLSDNCTASELRQTKPILFLAIMAATSHRMGAELSNRLHQEIISLYAERLFINGEKSLECVQSLLVTVAYSTPPASPSQLQFYQYGNMAATMALELGIASKPRTSEQLPKRDWTTLQRVSSSGELLENCRTVLACYLLTAGLAMRVRGPNILSFNSWMAESLLLLDKSPLLVDQRIAAWVRLQRIADEATTAFGLDDASTSFSLDELRMQATLRSFERRMEEWKQSTAQGVLDAPLVTMAFYQNTISMWEFAMDNGTHDAPDFRNKFFTLPSLDGDELEPETPNPFTSLQVSATLKCISAAQSQLDVFLNIPIPNLRTIPNVLYVRAIYALTVLMKADYAIGTDPAGLGELIHSQDLRTSSYLKTIIEKTTEAIGPNKCRVPSHWLHLTQVKIVPWYEKYLSLLKQRQNPNQPLSNLHGSDISTPQSSESSQRAASVGAPQAQPITFLTPMPGEPEFDPLPGIDVRPSVAAWPSTQPAPTNDVTQSGFGSDQPATSTEMSDFTMAFEQGNLYFWNDAAGVIDWTQQGDVYNDLGFWSPGQGS